MLVDYEYNCLNVIETILLVHVHLWFMWYNFQLQILSSFMLIFILITNKKTTFYGKIRYI